MVSPFSQFMRDVHSETALIQQVHAFADRAGVVIDLPLPENSKAQIKWYQKTRGEFATLHDVPPESKMSKREKDGYVHLQQVIQEGLFAFVDLRELGDLLGEKGERMKQRLHDRIKEMLFEESKTALHMPQGDEITRMALVQHIFKEVYLPLEAQAIAIDKISVKAQRQGRPER